MVAVLVVSAAGAAGPDKVLEQNLPPVTRDMGAGEDVFLDQTPNQSNGIFSDISCDICTQGVQILADDFQVISGGMGIDIDTIIIYGGYYPNNIPVAANFDVVVYEDAAGLPGTTVCTENLAPTLVIDTGVDLFGVDERQVTIDLAGDCILQDGFYWIQIATDTGTGTDDWFWEVGNLDVTYGRIGQVFSFEYPPVTWSFDDVTDLSISINGTIVPVELQSISVE
jgi:hypothetical protein